MLTEKEKKTLQICEKRLAIPTFKFVLIYGILLWGLPVGIIVGLLDIIEGDTSFAQLVKQDLWIRLGTFMTGGIIFGLVMREFIRRQYARLKQRE